MTYLSRPIDSKDAEHYTSLFGILRQAGALIRERRMLAREQSRIRHELSQYSDRQLADLGLSRADIDGVARAYVG